MQSLLNPQLFLDGSIDDVLSHLPPVSWQPEGYWAVLGFAEGRRVLSESQLFSSAFGTGPVSELDRQFSPHGYDPAHPPCRHLNLCDPPAHTSLRQHLEEWISSHPLVLPASLFEPLRVGGEISESLLRRLPRQTLTAMLEVDEELACYLQDIGLRLAYAEDAALTKRSAFSRWKNAEEELREALQAVRCGLGTHLPLEERHHLLRLLVLASLESTTTALAGLLIQLTYPQVWQQAQSRRAYFVEDFLRQFPPIQRFARLAIQNVRLGETEIQTGQRVVVFFRATNCGADISNHLSFGAGPHRCPGAGMARKILRALLDACLDLPQPPQLELQPLSLIHI